MVSSSILTISLIFSRVSSCVTLLPEVPDLVWDHICWRNSTIGEKISGTDCIAVCNSKNKYYKRMHSSRIRTGRSLTVCLGGGSACRGGFSLLGGGRSPCRGVSLPGGPPCQWGGGGILPAGGPSLPGGSPCLGGSPCQWGGILPAGGPSLPGRSPCLGGSPCQGGASLLGGFSLLETPPVDRITDTSKNIALATTSLRPVIKDVWEIRSPSLLHRDKIYFFIHCS